MALLEDLSKFRQQAGLENLSNEAWRDINARIKELKRLQNILGGVNDMEVQRNRLSDFTRELQADSAVGTSCILTLGRLAASLEERQEELRSAFHDAFKEFSSNPVQAAFSRLLSVKPPK